MNQNVEGVYSVRIELPDTLYAPAWQAYARVSRDETDEDGITRFYRRALEVIEGGTFTVDGVEHDIKTTPIEKTPVAVMKWIGDRVTVYVSEQFAIEKNSSAPSSDTPTGDSTSG